MALTVVKSWFGIDESSSSDEHERPPDRDQGDGQHMTISNADADNMMEGTEISELMSNEHINLMFPQITVTIDKTRSAVFGDSEFWKFIESQFDVSIKKTNDARFCRIIGDGAKVIAAQKQIIAVVFQNSNNTTKQRRDKKSSNRTTKIDEKAFPRKANMINSQNEKKAEKAELMTLNTDCWQYFKESHSAALSALHEKFDVEITTSTCIEIVSKTNSYGDVKEAAHWLREVIASVGVIKKMTLCGIYDKEMLRKSMPEMSGVIFENKGDLLQVIGPEMSLRKLNLFLRDASANPLEPPIEVPTSLVVPGPLRHGKHDTDPEGVSDTDYRNAKASDRKIIDDSGSLSVADKGSERGSTDLKSLTHHRGLSGEVVNTKQKIIDSGARPKQNKSASTKIGGISVEQKSEQSQMSRHDIIKLATGADSAEFTDDESDDNSAEDIGKHNSGKQRQECYSSDVDDFFCGFTHTKSKQSIILCTADITKMTVDAIVNAANAHMMHMGGVALAIAKAAGPQLQQESTEYMNKNKKDLKVAETVVTNGYKLPAKHVIHVTGPRWMDYTGKEKKAIVDLRKTVANVFRKAHAKSFRSIALPAISSGNYGMPWEYVTTCIFDSVVNLCATSTKVKLVYIVDLRSDLLKIICYKLLEVKSFEPMMEPELSSARTYLGQGRENRESIPRRTTKVNPPGTEIKVSGPEKSSTADEQKNHKKEHQSPSSHGNELKNNSRVSISPEWDTPNENWDNYPDNENLSTGTHLQNKHNYDTGMKHPLTTSTDRLFSDGKPLNSSAANQAGTAAPSAQQTLPQLQNTDGSKRRDPLKPNNDRLSSGGKPPPSSAAGQAGTAATHTMPHSPDADDLCAICLDAPTKPFTLPKCKHVFCTECIRQSFEYNPVCPSCGMSYGKRVGNQPQNGTMTVRYDGSGLPGYDKYGSIVISYSFPSGVQTKEHPTPGQKYDSTNRTAYLPDNTEGKHVLKLLRKAFEARLTFTVGTSVTTGKEAQVTWNDIHHKTNRQGGPARFGYPDPTYLSRVKEELAAKGIK